MQHISRNFNTVVAVVFKRNDKGFHVEWYYRIQISNNIRFSRACVWKIIIIKLLGHVD